MRIPGRGQSDDDKKDRSDPRSSRGTGREQPDSGQRGWLGDRRQTGSTERPGGRSTLDDDDLGFVRDKLGGQRRPGQSSAADDKGKDKDEGSSGRFGSFMRRGGKEDAKPDERPARPTGQYGSPPRRGEESKPGGGRPGSSGRSSGKDEDKSGGILGRFGGRGKKDDEKKDSVSSTGQRSPFIRGTSDDSDSSTGGLARPGSGFGSRDRKDQPGSARPGGFGSRDRDDPPSGTRSGGFGSRDREDQPGSARPGSGFGSRDRDDPPGGYGVRPGGGMGTRDREDQPGGTRPASGFGSRDREDQPGSARPGGGFGSRDRDDQPGGYGARPGGGFGSRDREDQPGSARPGSGFGSRDRTDQPGGASSRFGTSTTDRDTSDRPGFTPRSASQSSSLPERRSPFGTETDRGKKDKADEEKKSGGILGRFGSRGKEQKKEDKKPDTSSRSTFGGGSSATRTTGTSPAAGSSARPQTGFGSPSGTARGTPQPTRTPTREEDRSRRGAAPPKKADKAPPQPKTRAASKGRTAPLPEGKQKGALTAHQGLDFERKIDLIGVALVGFALVAFFAVIPSMSFGLMAEPETGLTGSLNQLLSQLFGWGKIVWPVFAFGVGVWLMVHSFAETDFELNYFRIFGVISLYLCALAFIQMIELVNDSAPTVDAFKPISHDVAIEQGRGGGWLGHQIYTFLLSQFLDLGTVSVLFAWLVISLMATFDLSVVELWGYVAGAFLFLRPNPEARARRRAAREARTAEIISAMRPGEPARQVPTASAAATALPTQTQEAPVVQTERRRFGVGRKTGETTPVAPDQEATSTPPAASVPPAAAPDAAGQPPTRSGPMINRRGSELAAAASLSTESAGQESASPGAESTNQEARPPERERRPMPHLRTQDVQAEESNSASDIAVPEQADELAGRGRFGMFRRGRGEASAEAPEQAAEKDSGLVPAGNGPRRETGSPPAIPVPPRRAGTENLAGETPAGSPREEKPAEEQPGRLGRFMRRPSREASDTPPTESAAQESKPGEKRERLLPFGRSRVETPTDAENGRETSIRERMSPFGRRPLPGTNEESDKPQEPEKPAADQDKPGVEGIAAAGALGAADWLSRRPEDKPTDGDRPDRPDRSRSPLSEPPVRADDSTPPADESAAPRPRPLERLDRPDRSRSPLSEPPVRADESVRPADESAAPRPRSFERLDRPDRSRSSLSEPPVRADDSTPPADESAAPRPRPFERPDRPRSPLSEPPLKDEDTTPPAPVPSEPTPADEKSAEPVGPPAQPARPDLLHSRPLERVDRPPLNIPARRPSEGALRPLAAEDKAAEQPAAPESPEEAAPVNEPPARPRGLAALRSTPFGRPLPGDSSRESRPVPPPDVEKSTEKSDEPGEATAHAEIPTVEAPPLTETPAETPAETSAKETDTARAAPPAEDQEKPAPAGDTPVQAPVAAEPAAPRRFLPGARGTPRTTPPAGNAPGAGSLSSRPTTDTPKPPATSSGPAAPSRAEALPPRPSTVSPRTESPPSAPQTPSVRPPFGRPGREPAAAVASGPNAPESRLNTPQKGKFHPPDFTTLLRKGEEQHINDEYLLDKARVIEDTLMSFGAPGKVVEVNPGPVITQFGVEPSYLESRGGKRTRVKVGSIARLDADLALALAAKSIRIEAPVPGKGYVGIEVPNDEVAMVGLLDIMQSPEFKRIDSKLRIALGLAVDGSPVAADLTAMPHLLIAGTTGSGKSVCVNAIISCLLLQNTPEDVQFIMVDPKRVELTGYNGIPHLVAPVVVDLERIVGVLQWVQREMEERYRKFAAISARNILDYNNKLEPGTAKMPYYVVVVDELADLMMLAPDETERLLARLAQMARATGIHLIISTQRPSVDIITGLIKANFPARIAFAVASSVDSRVILDQPGAEKLLGRGDMLYQSPDAAAPLRMQGVFVSDEEIIAITRYWRGTLPDQPSGAARDLPVPGQLSRRPDVPVNRTPPPAADEDVDTPPRRPGRSDQPTLWEAEAGDDDDMTGEDELYDQAVELVQRLGKASISLLQRRLRIGYTRAARLIDRMEVDGIVGPSTEGSKPREVLKLKNEDAGDD